MSDVRKSSHPLLKVLSVGGVLLGAYELYKAYQNYYAQPKDQPLRLPRKPVTTNNPNLSIQALSSKQSIDEVSFEGKRVLMRVDYNVPVKDGVVTDATRITCTLDSIRHILKYKVKCLVLLAHLGQPNAASFVREKYTLRPCVPVLQAALPGVPILFVDDCVGPEVEKAINTCAPGTLILTENLRFHIEEIGSAEGPHGEKITAADKMVADFKRQLSVLGDIFVFEAFGAAHRPHASIVGISLPQRVAGKLMKRELDYYAQVLGKPQRPFVCVLGGAKVTDKIHVIFHLLDICDEMYIGGGMAYTFKKVLKNVTIGKSIFDAEGAKRVPEIMKKAEEKGVQMHFPVDHVIADKFSEKAKIGLTTDEMGVPADWMALDIGPRSCAELSTVMRNARTVLWNGPVGVYEMGPFAAGTICAMGELVEATKAGATTILGGGDTAAASMVIYYGQRPVSEQVSWVSTGGGSSLVLMEGKMLPGVQYLSDKFAAGVELTAHPTSGPPMGAHGVDLSRATHPPNVEG